MTELDEQRFFARVNKTETCWLWTGSKDGCGYGLIQIIPKSRPLRAHRLSYEHHHGPIPAGLVVRHRCDVPNCVNPEHLLVGTQADNVADSVERGRMQRGERSGKAKLTADRVLELRSMYAAHIRVEEIAERFEVTVAVISAIATGRHWKHVGGICEPRGRDLNRFRRLATEQVVELRNAYRSGMPTAELASRFSVNRSYASSVATGKYYPELPGACPKRRPYQPRRRPQS